MIPKRYITIINLVLGLLLVLSAGYLAWSLYSNRQITEETIKYSPLEHKEQEVVVPEQDYYQIIIARDLWETKFEAPEDRPPPTPKPPPVPHPKLKLIGTSISWDPSRNRAIIEDVKSRTQNIYKVGDVIRGAKLMEIDRTQVVLNNQGRRFVISSFLGHIPVPKIRVPFARVLRRIGKNKWLVSRCGLWKTVNIKVLIGMVQKKDFKVVPEDVMRALRLIGCRPYYPPGQPQSGDSEGYEVVVLPRDRMAFYLGVKQGDIIRKINGQMITGKKSAIELLNKVQDSPKVLVEIRRGQELITLEYIIQEEELEPEE